MSWLHKIIPRPEDAKAKTQNLLKLNSKPEYKPNLMQLIRTEATIGAQIFGRIPAGRKREFFMLENGSWVWYEEWQTETGRVSVTTRYEIHGYKIYKSHNNGALQQLHGDELTNFSNAVRTYRNQVATRMYGYQATA